MKDRLVAFLTAVDAALVDDAGGETLKVYPTRRAAPSSCS